MERIRTVHTWRPWAWLRVGHFEQFLFWRDPCLKIYSVKLLQMGELQYSICREHKAEAIDLQSMAQFCQSHAHRLKAKTDSLSLLSILLPDTAHRIDYLHALWLAHELSLTPI